MNNRHVGRRAFLQAAALGVGMAVTSKAEDAPVESQDNQTAASIKYWMHGFESEDPKALAGALRDAGFNVVVAGGAAVIEAVTGAGMEAWLCGGGFPLVRDEDALKARDVHGAPQRWFGSGSPCCPEIQEASSASYTKMAATEGITGILVDGVRFASPASGLMPFLTDFSEHAEKRAGELGFDFSLMKRDVTALHALLTGLAEERSAFFARLASSSGMLEWLTGHPGILEWLRFRRTHTTSHFKALSAIIHGAGLKMGVYIFTPCMAPLVGQSYHDLREFVDVFAPMIYRNYPDHPGPACLNWELAELPGELGLAGAPEEAAVVNAILAWAGFAGLDIAPRVETVKKELPPETVGLETGRARALLGKDKELAPIIYIDDPMMKDTARLARENGADGINFFVFKQDWAAMTRPAFV